MSYNFIVYYLLAGVVFNFLYDKLIDVLGEDHEDARFNMTERAIIMVTWPIALLRFLFGFFSNNSDNG